MKTQRTIQYGQGYALQVVCVVVRGRKVVTIKLINVNNLTGRIRI